MDDLAVAKLADYRVSDEVNVAGSLSAVPVGSACGEQAASAKHKCCREFHRTLLTLAAFGAAGFKDGCLPPIGSGLRRLRTNRTGPASRLGCSRRSERQGDRAPAGQCHATSELTARWEGMKQAAPTRIRTVAHALPAVAAVVMLAACTQLSNTEGPTAPGILPPDPIVGPDANGDGVQDDIAQYIETTFADEPHAYQAALQYAKARRDELATPVTREAVVAAVAASSRAHECMLYVQRQRAPELRNKRMVHELDARTLDTDARIHAHFTRRKLLGGMHYALTDLAQAHTTCDFDTSSVGAVP
jgi:hypothetical protein